MKNARQQMKERIQSYKDQFLDGIEFVDDSSGYGFEAKASYHCSNREVLESYDNSLLPVETRLDDTTWIYRASGCGQCRDMFDKLEYTIVDEDWLDEILLAWDNHHLDEDFRLDINIEQNRSNAIRECTLLSIAHREHLAQNQLRNVSMVDSHYLNMIYNNEDHYLSNQESDLIRRLEHWFDFEVYDEDSVRKYYRLDLTSLDN